MSVCLKLVGIYDCLTCMKALPKITPVPKYLAPQVNFFKVEDTMTPHDLFLPPLSLSECTCFENQSQKNGKMIKNVETKRRTKIAIMCKRRSLEDLSGN